MFKKDDKSLSLKSHIWDCTDEAFSEKLNRLTEVRITIPFNSCNAVILRWIKLLQGPGDFVRAIGSSSQLLCENGLNPNNSYFNNLLH